MDMRFPKRGKVSQVRLFMERAGEKLRDCNDQLAGKHLGEFADGGGEGCFGGLAVGEGGAEARVEFVSAGGADDFREVGSVDAAAGENDDEISGGDDQIRQRGGAQ